MENTRDLKTLLEILLKEVESNLHHGLCNKLLALHRGNLISGEEWVLLHNFLDTHRPKWYQYGYSFKYRNHGYWWTRGNKTPRIKFLKHWIKKLNK